MEITPEQINQFISDSILKSTIGQSVEAAVKKVVTDLCSQWKNPFEEVIKQEVYLIIQEELQTKYKETLKSALQEKLSSYLSGEVVSKIVDAAIDKLRREY